jgi:outer membrane PBP1 activator LpoA protein
MKRILTAVIVAAIVAACATNAPQRVAQAPVVPQASLKVSDSVTFKASPELQKSLDQLAASVQALATRVATDPELHAAAIQLASSFVATAQQVVSEQAVVLEQALKTAAQKISESQATHQAPPPKR